MPYRDLPLGIRRALRGILGVIYAIALLGGVASIVFPPAPVLDTIGRLLVTAFSVMTMVGGAGGLLAVVRDNYRTELAAVPILGGGVAMYAMTSLMLTASSPTRASSAAMTTMLALFCVFRGLELLGHDQKMRRVLRDLDL